MTEELARTKWCPMVRCAPSRITHGELEPGNTAYNKMSTSKGIELLKSSMCIASDCMMWREEYSDNHSNGYCGLAGKL